MSRTLVVGVCQLRADIGTEGFDPRPGNLARAVEAVTRVARRGAQIALIGECYLTGYRTDEYLEAYAVLIEPPDTYVDQLAQLTKSLGIHVVIGSAARRTERGPVHNSALVFGPQGYIGAYDKVHLGNLVFDDGRRYDETQFFTAGTEIPVFTTSIGVLGIQICRDNRYPEVSRAQTLQGADVIINITAPDPAATKFWEAATYVRATENQICYVMAAIVGRQGTDTYSGTSRVIGPDGVEHARASGETEEDIVVSLDFDETRRARDAGQVLQYRAPKAYRTLVEDVRPL
jgi:predicted amidohydrolase